MSSLISSVVVVEIQPGEKFPLPVPLYCLAYGAVYKTSLDTILPISFFHCVCFLLSVLIALGLHAFVHCLKYSLSPLGVKILCLVYITYLLLSLRLCNLADQNMVVQDQIDEQLEKEDGMIKRCRDPNL